MIKPGALLLRDPDDNTLVGAVIVAAPGKRYAYGAGEAFRDYITLDDRTPDDDDDWLIHTAERVGSYLRGYVVMGEPFDRIVDGLSEEIRVKLGLERKAIPIVEDEIEQEVRVSDQERNILDAVPVERWPNLLLPKREIPDSCENVYQALLEKGYDESSAAAITNWMHNEGRC